MQTLYIDHIYFDVSESRNGREHQHEAPGHTIKNARTQTTDQRFASDSTTAAMRHHTAAQATLSARWALSLSGHSGSGTLAARSRTRTIAAEPWCGVLYLAWSTQVWNNRLINAKRCDTPHTVLFKIIYPGVGSFPAALLAWDPPPPREHLSAISAQQACWR